MGRQIIELRGIFSDLSNMISSQGETIDHIEQNIENADYDVDKGNVELSQAKIYREKCRNKMCCLIIILIILLLAFLIIIGIFFSTNNIQSKNY